MSAAIALTLGKCRVVTSDSDFSRIPSLDVEDYIERMLTNLSPVLRERLLRGDWSIRERKCWLKLGLGIC